MRQEFKDIYYCCCFCCLDSLAKWDQNFQRPTLPNHLEFLFDRKPKYEGYAARIYYEVVREIAADTGKADLLGDMSFGDKTKDVPLQMADLVVGAAIRHFRRQARCGLDVEPDRLITRLNAKTGMFFMWLEKELLLRLNSASEAARHTVKVAKE